MRVFALIGALIFLGVSFAGSAMAQEKLVVATIEREPFSFETDGNWSGYTMDMLSQIGDALEVEFAFQEFTSFGSMLTAVEEGQVDLAAANISVTASREQVMDFSRAIFDSGLTILAPMGSSASIYEAFWDRRLWGWVLLAFCLFCVAGGLIALFERREEFFKTRNIHNKWREGFWWSVTVVTNASFTIYTPVTYAGRFLSYILIIIGLFLVSGFVAQITATLTVNELQSKIDGVNDLIGKQVATTRGSSSSAYLVETGIPHKTYDDLTSLFAALEDGSADAVVHDAPLLNYYAKNKGDGAFSTTGGIFKPEKLGLAFPQGSPLVERFNQQILRLQENGTSEALRVKWFGR